MNLNLMNGRIKKNSEGVKDLWEAIEALKKGAPVPAPTPTPLPVPVALPAGSDIDMS